MFHEMRIGGISCKHLAGMVSSSSLVPLRLGLFLAHRQLSPIQIDVSVWSYPFPPGAHTIRWLDLGRTRSNRSWDRCSWRTSAVRVHLWAQPLSLGRVPTVIRSC